MKLYRCSRRLPWLSHGAFACRLRETHTVVKPQLETKPEAKLQKQICQVVLDHFENQYSKELGEVWSSIREVLTTPHFWQYAVLLNKFNFSSEVENELHLKGYRLLFPETTSCFRQSLKCYITSTPGRFPAQKHRAGLLHANECDSLRANWLKQTLESFIPESLMNLVITSQLDGRQIGNLQTEAFDKVLVDAPCSNDRSWLFSANTQQATLRLAQRKALSAVQIQLLRSAIKALRPGGSLVYSTCTLSKAENSDVINHILSSYSNILPVDISTLARAASQEFSLASDVQQHELLVLPVRGKAWGPMYISKLKKI
ncbi:tRNA (cytosine(34)-C(5))-methyltransferase, mitochondrial isoform X2 [Hemicordylus capensis]|uniref:tRNA (cytosine(34)-C(5))-methyltransferase, mitochondrial isoform X2 n=1 Tax=Hemicordylus capensis TaxID=884348 RepID=UPI00230484B1|nr:tRNA (cytosine(34)-C(5))-methyltransferase, mitochondrial isoform X2 [Hemicordylus capensis]